MSRIMSQLRSNEKVLWQGKPIKKAFIFSSGFFPATIFGLFFLIVFLVFFLPSFFLAGFPEFFVLLPALLFLIIPLLLILGPIIWALLAYSKTEYVITDQRLITQSGAIGVDTRFVDLEKIQEVYVRIGLFDRLFGTGNIMASTAGQVFVGYGGGYGYGGSFALRPSIAAIKEPYEIQTLLQEAIRNIKQNKSPI